MAKPKHQAEAEVEAPAPEVEASVVDESFTLSFSSKGIVFELAARYREGDTINKPEANTLNQTLVENLRNNFTPRIAAKLEAIAKAEGAERDLTEAEKEELKAVFQTYESEYTFQGKRGSRTPVDPVRREAVKMARETITAALRAKEISPKDLKEGQMDELIEGYLKAHAEVLAEARVRVDKAKEAASDALSGVDLGSITKAPAQAEAAE